MKRKNQSSGDKKKVPKVTNFHLVDEFIWTAVQQFCDMKTFLNFFYINKNSYKSVVHKESYFKEKITQRFGVDFKVQHKDSDFTYIMNFNSYPYLKLAYYMIKYHINPDEDVLHDYKERMEDKKIAKENGLSDDEEDEEKINGVFNGKYEHTMIYTQDKLSLWKFNYDEKFTPYTLLYIFNWKSQKWDCAVGYYRNCGCDEDLEISFLPYGLFCGECYNIKNEEMKIHYENRVKEYNNRYQDRLNQDEEDFDAESEKFKRTRELNDVLYNVFHVFEKYTQSLGDDVCHGNTSCYQIDPFTFELQEKTIYVKKNGKLYELTKWLGFEKITWKEADPNTNPYEIIDYKKDTEKEFSNRFYFIHRLPDK